MDQGQAVVPVAGQTPAPDFIPDSAMPNLSAPQSVQPDIVLKSGGIIEPAPDFISDEELSLTGNQPPDFIPDSQAESLLKPAPVATPPPPAIAGPPSWASPGSVEQAGMPGPGYRGMIKGGQVTAIDRHIPKTGIPKLTQDALSYFYRASDALASGIPFMESPQNYQKYAKSIGENARDLPDGAIPAVVDVFSKMLPQTVLMMGFSGLPAMVGLVSKVPAANAAIRALVGGTLSGLAMNPEDGKLLSRVKQIPSTVLFWGAMEAGFLTTAKALEIWDWKKAYGPMAGEIKNINIDGKGMKELLTKIRSGESGVKLTPDESIIAEQLASNPEFYVKSPGSMTLKPGVMKAGIEGTIESLTPEQAALRARAGGFNEAGPMPLENLPRKPRVGDIFRNPETLPGTNAGLRVKNWGDNPSDATPRPPGPAGQAALPPRQGVPEVQATTLPGEPQKPVEPQINAVPQARGATPGPVTVEVVPNEAGNGWKITLPSPEATPSPEVGKALPITPPPGSPGAEFVAKAGEAVEPSTAIVKAPVMSLMKIPEAQRTPEQAKWIELAPQYAESLKDNPAFPASGKEVTSPAEEPPQPSAEVSPKQPWQMTKEEYLAQSEDIAQMRDIRVSDDDPKNTLVTAQDRAKSTKALNAAIRNETSRHGDIVYAAVKSGNPVPPDVLADYPDLAAKVGTKAPRASLTRDEFRYNENKPKVDAIQARLKTGRSVSVNTYLRSTKLSRPDQIRIDKDGTVRIPEGRKWVALSDDLLDNVAGQAGVKHVPYSERTYFEDQVAPPAPKPPRARKTHFTRQVENSEEGPSVRKFPIKDLRFMPKVIPESWQEIYDATSGKMIKRPTDMREEWGKSGIPDYYFRKDGVPPDEVAKSLGKPNIEGDEDLRQYIVNNLNRPKKTIGQQDLEEREAYEALAEKEKANPPAPERKWDVSREPGEDDIGFYEAPIVEQNPVFALKGETLPVAKVKAKPAVEPELFAAGEKVEPKTEAPAIGKPRVPKYGEGTERQLGIDPDAQELRPALDAATPKEGVTPRAERDKIAQSAIEEFEKQGIPRKLWGPMQIRILQKQDISIDGLPEFIRKMNRYDVDPATGEWIEGAHHETIKRGKPLPESPELANVADVSESHEGVYATREKENLLKKRIFDIAGDDGKLIVSYFFDGKSFDEVAKDFNMSSEGVRKAITRHYPALREDKDFVALMRDRSTVALGMLYPAASGRQIKSLKNRVKSLFSSTRGMDRPIDRGNDERLGGRAGEEFLSTIEIEPLLEYMRSGGNNPVVGEFLDQILKGELKLADYPSIPLHVAKSLTETRKRMDALSEVIELELLEMIKTATPEQAKKYSELIKNIRNGIGNYVHRSFDIFEARGYYVPDPATEKGMADYLKTQPEFKDFTDKEIEGYMQAMIDGKTVFPRRMSSTGPSYNVETDILKKREVIPPVALKFMGEIKDPVYNAAKTIAQQVITITNAKFLKLVAEAMPGSHTADEAQARRLKFTDRLEDDISNGILAGHWVDKPLYEYIKGDQKFAMDMARSALQKWFVTPYKLGRTVLNPPTQARNFGSNGILAATLAGNSPFNPVKFIKYWIPAMKLSNSKKLNEVYNGPLKHIKGKTYREIYAEYLKRKVVGNQYIGSEIPDLKNEMLKRRPDDWIDAVYEKVFQEGPLGIVHAAGMLYNWGDAIPRIATDLKFQNEGLGWGDGPMSPEESVEMLDRTFQNYDKLGKAVDFLRKYPILGPFISWNANMLKNQVNQGRWAGKKLFGKDSTPKDRWRGGRQLLRLALLLLGPEITSQISKRVFNIDDDLAAEVQRKMSKFQRSGQFLWFRWPPWDPKGEPKYINMTYLNPIGDIPMSWIKTIINPANEQDLTDVLDKLNFLENPMMDLYQIIKLAQDPQTQKKFPKQNSMFRDIWYRSWQAIAKEYWPPALPTIDMDKLMASGQFNYDSSAMAPGSQIRAIIDSLHPDKEIGEFQYRKRFAAEVVGFVLGMRSYDISPEKNAGLYRQSCVYEISVVKNEYKYWVRKHPDASDAERKSRESNMKRMIADLQARIDESDALVVKIRESEKRTGVLLGRDPNKEKK